MSDDFSIQALASCINIIRPNDAQFDLWVGAMESGEYKYGYGVLRSDADEYDPFGVLIAIHYPEWSWDDDEGCWAHVGDTAHLHHKKVMEWLGVEREDAALLRFISAVTKLSDTCTHFGPVVRALRAARDRARREKERWGTSRLLGLGRGLDYDDNLIVPRHKSEAILVRDAYGQLRDLGDYA
jgi:hypothetical protein